MADGSAESGAANEVTTAAGLGQTVGTDLPPLWHQVDGLNGQSQDDLISLAVQAVTRARVEAIKFRRGDYL